MSRCLESLLDAERRAACAANDAELQRALNRVAAPLPPPSVNAERFRQAFAAWFPRPTPKGALS